MMARAILVAAAMVLPAMAAGPFAWNEIGGGRLELRENGRPVLVYNYGPQLKAGAPENRRRCCYIFPLYTPEGVSMLDDFPEDHWHHRGLFWAWPVVQAGGKTYDTWMNFTAQDRSTGTPSTAGGKQATLEASDVWRAGSEDIVREHVRLVAFAARARLRDLEVELTLEALHGPVTLQGSRENGKSYGGFSARFAARQNTILRADGVTLSHDEDLTPRSWAELEGVYEGKRAALRITPDPSGPGAPYQWCLRRYGFVGVSFPGRTADRDGYTLEPGNPAVLKFRVRVADEP